MKKITSKRELTDIAKAWGAISFAFAIVFYGFSFNITFLYYLVAAAITVGLGFLFHELAHKFIAQRYGCAAEFKSFDTMLILAIAFSLIGFVFAAPGAVMISGQVTRRENGIISVAGSITNIILAIIFLIIDAFFHLDVLKFGASINAWLALFNMIPLWILDGKKVWDWNKFVWGATAGIALMIRVVVGII